MLFIPLQVKVDLIGIEELCYARFIILLRFVKNMFLFVTGLQKAAVSLCNSEVTTKRRRLGLTSRNQRHLKGSHETRELETELPLMDRDEGETARWLGTCLG